MSWVSFHLTETTHHLGLACQRFYWQLIAFSSYIVNCLTVFTKCILKKQNILTQVSMFVFTLHPAPWNVKSLRRSGSFTDVLSSRTLWSWQTSVQRRQDWLWTMSSRLSPWTKLCNRWALLLTLHKDLQVVFVICKLTQGQQYNERCWTRRNRSAQQCNS